MRIGIDMAATAGQKSGLGFYVENLARHIEQKTQQSRKHELVKINRVKKNLRTPSRILWDQVGLPLTARRKNLDALFVPAFSAPRFDKPIIMTAHDIYGVIHPERFSTLARFYWQKVLPQSMHRADALVCISEHTKKDIIEHLGIAPEKLHVVPPSGAETFEVVRDASWVKKHLQDMNLDFPFILTVGTLEPRKNIARLIEAFAFSSRGDARLVIVGKKGWDYEDIFTAIQKYHLQDAVIFLDYVEHEQLVALYNACLFFIMPSVYEGFGLPPLEAMRCGAPVAVSQTTSLPEVVGDAGILFDPYSIEDMRAKMNLLFDKPVFRTDLQHKSFEQSKQFTWNRTASEILEIIENVVQNKVHNG